jgi:dipeptidyl aminopeptidase/acylaminoacyl peptidase
MTISAPSAFFTRVHPERRGDRVVTAEDMWRTPRVGAPVPAPNGHAFAVTVTRYDLDTNEAKSRVWLCAADGSDARALTSEDASSNEPAFAPDGAKLAFVRKDARGKPQIHVMPMDGGEAEKLTDLPLGAFDPKWLPDGSGIVFAARVLRGFWTPEATAAELERRDKDPVKAHVTEDRVYRYWDTWLTTGEVPHLFVLDLATRALRDLTPRSDAWFDWMDPSGQYDVSPDGKEVAYCGQIAQKDGMLLRSAIFTVPVAGGEVTCLTPDHPSQDSLPRYSPDGKTIVYGMQHDPFFYADRVRMMAYDRAARTHREILPHWALSPAHWTFAPDGTLYLEAEDDARTGLFAWKGSGEPRRIAHDGTIAGVRVASDGRVLCQRHTLSDPPEVYALGTRGEPARLTRFTEAALTGVAMGEVREMRFEGAKGETVQMFVVLPPNFDAKKRYPLVQVIHGGPHGISGDMFHFRWNPQLFAAPGYVVAMVNFQGSTSWGQDFAQRIQGGWGDRPFEDVMRATDVMIATGYVDETLMAAAGGSYGGYMASWIEGHTDRFRCIVNHAGVYNLLSQYASDVTQGRHKSMGGEPWDGLDGITRWNPAHAAEGFKTPMLVLHGERDYRVPVTQGLECYGVLKAKGIPARLVYFPDENHWVLKPRNSILWYREVHDWLQRWLG